MLPNKNKAYYCQQCNKYTSTLHEVIFGSSNRQISIRHNIQVPLCVECHALAHRNKNEYIGEFLGWLELDYWQTVRAYNDRSLRTYLEIHADDCKEKIKGLEV